MVASHSTRIPMAPGRSWKENRSVDSTATAPSSNVILSTSESAGIASRPAVVGGAQSLQRADHKPKNPLGLSRLSFLRFPRHHQFPGASPTSAAMDASTPLKRSSTDAGLDSPKGSNRSDSRAPAPKISKARACGLHSSPH